MEEQQPGDVEDEGAESGLPMPAPWAAAAAILLLVAFGFLIGSFVAPKEEAPPVLLASSPTGSATSTGAASAPAIPSTQATEEPESEEGGEEAPEAEEEVEEEGSEGEEGGEAGEGEEGSSGQESKGGKGGSGEGKSTGSGGKQQPTAESGLPPIKHVFLIVLGSVGYEAAFGANAKAPYLAKTLREQGELIEDYYAVTSGELANEIALVSGEGPTPQTAANCPLYEDVTPGKSGSEGQVLGAGCVYPASTKTIGDELTAAGKTWKAYIQGLEGATTATSATATATAATSATTTTSTTATSATWSCAHPEIGASDPNAAPTASDPYASWRDPFLYFHSTIDSASCAAETVDEGSLPSDLKSANSTPSLSYIAPDPCDDGDPEPCAPGMQAGPPAAEAFLKEVVPEIEQSPAYEEDGLIAITFDEAPQSGEGADSTGCCLAAKFPNLTTGTSESSGGGRVGLLLISKYVKPGSVDPADQFDHFSLLASMEQLFKLEPLGYSGALGLLHFNASVYNAPR